MKDQKINQDGPSSVFEVKLQDTKVKEFESYATKLDNFVTKQDLRTAKLISEIKSYNENLQKIF